MENSVNGTAAKVVGVSIKQDSHMQDDSVMPASANSECATVQGLKTNSYYKRCSLCGAFWGGVCGGVCGAVCGAVCGGVCDSCAAIGRSVEKMRRKLAKSLHLNNKLLISHPAAAQTPNPYVVRLTRSA
jgi:hypothetical protein